MDRAPKVFISYSWKSEEYKDCVRCLAEKLVRNGVEVILDQWHLDDGDDLDAFMENSIRNANRVLILCEESYVKKANAREGGAGVETSIITHEVYRKSRQNKFIPVFMESHDVVPDYLKSRKGISYRNQSDKEFNTLLRTVYGKRVSVPPPLGSPPAWLVDETPAPAPTEETKHAQEVEAQAELSAEKQPAPIAEKQPEPEVELSPQIPPVKTDVPYIPASQQTEKPVRTPGPEYDYEITPEGVIITKYKGRGGKVEIPGEIGGQPVVKIAKGAFDYCTTLSGVTIPDSVTAIGTRAFNHCTGLISVMLPASLTRIGNSAFCECSSLKYIQIPGRVESIGQFAFDKCSSLEALTLPVSVRHIYSHAFSSTSLKTVYYDGSKRRWAGIVIEKGNEALAHAERRYDVIEPASPVEDFAYESSSDGVTITKYKGKGGEVVIPDEAGGIAVTAIGREAFEYCEALTSVSIPDSVTSIGDWAFHGCTGLTSVSIPDSVTSIGYTAFHGCISLPAIDVQDANTSFTAVDGVLYSCDLKTLLAYPAGRKAATFTIPDSVTSIGRWAFSGCTSLTSVTIPDSVTSIGHMAFDSCTGLTSVSIPDSVTSIGGWTFDGCENLKDVFYAGSRSQWKAIEIDHDNDPLKNATINFAREEQYEDKKDRPWWRL